MLGLLICTWSQPCSFTVLAVKDHAWVCFFLGWVERWNLRTQCLSPVLRSEQLGFSFFDEYHFFPYSLLAMSCLLQTSRRTWIGCFLFSSFVRNCFQSDGLLVLPPLIIIFSAHPCSVRSLDFPESGLYMSALKMTSHLDNTPLWILMQISWKYAGISFRK